MGTRQHSLSATIICKDEEDRIIPCLESLKDFADEIIVLDSGSTDRTVEIVRQYTDKVWITEDWPGDGFQKQRALDKAVCDWVLIIDADEYLDADMQNSIEEILCRDTIEETAFKLPWGNIILDRQMKYGRSARAPKRLFKREGASITPVVVHAHVETKGKTATISDGYLMHNSHRDFDHWLIKNRTYSWATTEKYFAQGKKSYGLVFAIVRALWTFLLIFVIRLGFLDGRRGLLSAVMFAQASFNKYAGLWYLEQSTKLKQKSKTSS